MPLGGKLFYCFAVWGSRYPECSAVIDLLQGWGNATSQTKQHHSHLKEISAGHVYTMSMEIFFYMRNLQSVHRSVFVYFMYVEVHNGSVHCTFSYHIRFCSDVSPSFLHAAYYCTVMTIHSFQIALSSIEHRNDYLMLLQNNKFVRICLSLCI